MCGFKWPFGFETLPHWLTYTVVKDTWAGGHTHTHTRTNAHSACKLYFITSSLKHILGCLHINALTERLVLIGSYSHTVTGCK